MRLPTTALALVLLGACGHGACGACGAERPAPPRAATTAHAREPATDDTLVDALAVGARIEVTQGSATRGATGLEVGEAKFRAVVPDTDGDRVALGFRYLGRTRTLARLGSGEERDQLGLKLRAQDTCNLLYVMWRLRPRAGVVVSVKHNPGQSTHAQCGNRGYTNVRPRRSAPVPPLEPGARHTLAATIVGQRLEVEVDGASVWSGTVGAVAARLEGPVGLRSDNAAFVVETLRVSRTRAGRTPN